MHKINHPSIEEQTDIEAFVPLYCEIKTDIQMTSYYLKIYCHFTNVMKHYSLKDEFSGCGVKIAFPDLNLLFTSIKPFKIQSEATYS